MPWFLSVAFQCSAYAAENQVLASKLQVGMMDLSKILFHTIDINFRSAFNFVEQPFMILRKFEHDPYSPWINTTGVSAPPFHLRDQKKKEGKKRRIKGRMKNIKSFSVQTQTVSNQRNAVRLSPSVLHLRLRKHAVSKQQMACSGTTRKGKEKWYRWKHKPFVLLTSIAILLISTCFDWVASERAEWRHPIATARYVAALLASNKAIVCQWHDFLFFKNSPTIKPMLCKQEWICDYICCAGFKRVRPRACSVFGGVLIIALVKTEQFTDTKQNETKHRLYQNQTNPKPPHTQKTYMKHMYVWLFTPRIYTHTHAHARARIYANTHMWLHDGSFTIA